MSVYFNKNLRTAHLSSFRSVSVNIRIRNHILYFIFRGDPLILFYFIILEIRKYLVSICFKGPGVTNFGIFQIPTGGNAGVGVYHCQSGASFFFSMIMLKSSKKPSANVGFNTSLNKTGNYGVISDLC